MINLKQLNYTNDSIISNSLELVNTALKNKKDYTLIKVITTSINSFTDANKISKFEKIYNNKTFIELKNSNNNIKYSVYPKVTSILFYIDNNIFYFDKEIEEVINFIEKSNNLFICNNLENILSFINIKNSINLINIDNNNNYFDTKFSVNINEELLLKQEIIELFKKDINFFNKKYKLIDKKYIELTKNLPYILNKIQNNGINFNLDKLNKLEEEKYYFIKEKSLELIKKLVFLEENLDEIQNINSSINEIIIRKIDNYLKENGINLKIGKNNIPNIGNSSLVLSGAINIDGIADLKDILDAKNEFKQIRNIKNSLKSYLNNNKINPNFNYFSSTSRIITSKPNIQGLFKSIKDCIEAPSGYNYISIDFKQIEIKIALAVSINIIKKFNINIKNYNLLNAINSGVDLHSHTAEVLGIDRDSAKTVNFGILYGQGSASLYESGIVDFGLNWNLESATKAREDWINYYEEIKTLIDYVNSSSIVDEDGDEIFMLNTLLGREVYTNAMHTAISYAIQGSGAEILISCLNCLNKLNKYNIAMIIHDEIIFLVENNKLDIVKNEIYNIMKNIAEEIIYNCCGENIKIDLDIDIK